MSRLSPSILLTFPVKRQRRYGSSSLPFFKIFFLFCKPSLACKSQTCTVAGINCFHCESETLALPGILDRYQKLAYYNWPEWFCLLQPKEGKPLLNAIPPCSLSHNFPNTFVLFWAPFLSFHSTCLLSCSSGFLGFLLCARLRELLRRELVWRRLCETKFIQTLTLFLFLFRWRSTSHLFLTSGFLTVCTAPSHPTVARASYLTLVRSPVTCPNPRLYHRRLVTKVKPSKPWNCFAKWICFIVNKATARLTFKAVIQRENLIMRHILWSNNHIKDQQWKNSLQNTVCSNINKMIQKKKCPIIKLALSIFTVGALHLTGLVDADTGWSYWVIFLWWGMFFSWCCRY